MPRELPIVLDGKLRDDAVFIMLGHMLYPEDKDAAEQYSHVAAKEYHASKEVPSSLFGVVTKSLELEKLRFAGAVALLRTLPGDGEAGLSLSKAAFLVSELHSTDTDADGKPLPSSENMIRRIFGEYSAVAHLWSAFQLDRYTQTESSLIDFLAISKLVQTKLTERKVELKNVVWEIPYFEGQRSSEWPESGLIENIEEIDRLLKGFGRRSGGA